MAVAATVAAGFALANPASAATATSVSVTPSTATVFTGTAQTYNVTSNPAAANTVVAEASIPKAAAAANPLTVASGPAVSADHSTASAWVTDLPLTTGADGKATFTVQSSAGGTVSIIVGNGTTTPSASVRDTASLTVVQASASGPDFDVKSLSASPASLKAYDTESTYTIDVTATGQSGLAVASATVNSVITVAGQAPVAGPSGTTAIGSDGKATASIAFSAAQLGATSTTGANASVVFYVNNATTVPITSGMDASDTKSNTVSTVVDHAPDYDTVTLTSPNDSTDLQQGVAGKTSYVVTVTNAGAGVSGVKVAVDVTPTGGTAKRYSGVTGTDGTATIPVTVSAADATGSLSAHAYVSEQATVGTGDQATDVTDNAVGFSVPAQALTAPSAIQAVKGGTVSYKVTVADQFGNTGGNGDALTYTVTGGNTTSGTATVSGGTATISYTDAAKTGATDTVHVTDVTHPAYTGGATVDTTVTYVTSLTPGTVVWATQPGVGVTDTVDSTVAEHYTVHLTSTAGDDLVNQPVKVSVNLGFVSGDPAATAKDSSATATVTTGAGGIADVYVGSEKIGKQTITASAGSAKAASTTNAIEYTADQATTVKVAGPSNIVPGNSATFKATATDEFGNPVEGDNIDWTNTGAGAFNYSIGMDNTDANGQSVAVIVTSTNDSGSGTVTATDTNGVPDPVTGDRPSATAKFTVNKLSAVVVDGASGAQPGKAERVAVSVWPNQAASGTFTVSGANSATGTVTTGANGRANVYYTPTKAGTDTVTVTIDGVTGKATIKVASTMVNERPKISVSSRVKNLVVVTVTTHPAFTNGMVVRIYKNKHGHWMQTGHVKTDKTGWGRVTLHAASGVHLILAAKGASSKYNELLSKTHKVQVK